MKNIISLFQVVLMILLFVSCDENEIFEKEQYKTVVYLLSTTNQTYTVECSLENTEPVAYFSIGCGGSNSNSEGFTVELEYDTILFNQYNKTNFDIDTAFFAHLLSTDRYSIPSMTVDYPANNPEQYVRVPVNLRIDGLSPDSTYFIPLAIKSVSRYEINPDKWNMLFRVAISNHYASQVKTTYYSMLGNKGEVGISATKPVYPLTKNSVRVLVDENIQTDKTSLADVEKYSIILEVNNDNTVTIKPYGTIDVEMLYTPPGEQVSLDGENVFEETEKEQVFYLYYRYRTLVTPASEGNEAVYSNWVSLKERLTRSLK